MRQRECDRTLFETALDNLTRVEPTFTRLLEAAKKHSKRSPLLIEDPIVPEPGAPRTGPAYRACSRREAQPAADRPPWVLEDRRRSYGDPAASMAAIAARWSVTLGRPVTPAQVVLCLIDLKLARLAHDPAHLDSLRDVAGYSAVLREVVR